MVPIARLLTFAILLTSVAAPAAEVPQYSIEEFLATTTMRGADFSPDGSKILVSSDASGIFNAVAIPVDGGEPVTLTESTDHPVWIRAWFPDDERFLYSQDEGGNELTHLYVRNLDGSVQDLTPGEGLKAEWVDWSGDGTSFFVSTNERDPKHFDLYRYDTASFDREMVYTNEAGYGLGGVSPSGRYVMLQETLTTSVSGFHVWDAKTGETRQISPDEPTGGFSGLAFHPDEEVLLYRENQTGDFHRLFELTLATGETRELFAPSWDVAGARYSPDGTTLAVWTNEDASTRIHLFDTATMERVDAPWPDGSLSGPSFSREGDRVAFYASSGQSPGDLHVLDLSARTVAALSSNLSPAIDPEHLVRGEVVRFASYDGVEIPGILYKPHQATATDLAPALVWVHGGPGGQSRIGYSGQLQFLVNHGYAIYAINNRGSSGYGKAFHQMDDRRHGEADLQDVVASKQMLIDTGWVDPAEIGIFGGSYGGYMVLAALTLTPTEFAVGVDLFGISNWVRTLEAIPPYWESFREALYAELGDPAEDRERLHRISPIFHADKIQRPLMVLQGANDPRVLQVESDEIVEAARANGVPVEYIVFDDEGHGFRNKENRMKGYQAVLEFLNEHLRTAQPAG